MTEELTTLEKAALLSGESVWETRAVPRHGIRTLWLSDGPHGIRKQTGSADHLGLGASQPATCFPTAATVANSWDPELALSVGEALGAEAADQGVDVLLGPGLNVKRSPLCGRNFEYFSEDPLLSGRLAAGYVRGIQSRGVAACPKHFAANSQELRRMTSDSVVDERTLREIYLTGFEVVVRESSPFSIMSSYNLINGTYANENPFLLQQVLRDEWGFDGAVVTDWGGGNDAVEAVRRGGTLEMPSPGLDSAAQIVAAVERGDLDMADLDARVEEMKVLGSRIGGAGREVDLDAHHELARTVAEQSAVLLRNEDHLLPLASGTRVAVVGDFAATPRYQGAGSSVVNPTRLTTALDALGASDLQVVATAQGFTRGGDADPALVAEAVDAARTADVVLLYLGLDEISESEGQDRSHLRLPPSQVELLARISSVTSRIVVVLSAGSVVEVPWLSQCGALVHGYLGGQGGAEAVVRVLTGAVNPSGRLAESYPVRLEDVPNARYYPGEGVDAEYREGPYVGYRYYSTVGVPVAFPFGFGLSYTTFAYTDLAVDADGVTFTLTNTGDVAGAEVAQLYVGRQDADGVHRPVRELKGFAKVHLAPGESRRVRIDFDRFTFRHFSTTSSAWETEGGAWTLAVGSDVETVLLTAEHVVAGTAAADVDAVPDEYRTGRVTDVSDEAFATLLGRPLAPRGQVTGPLGVNSPLSDMEHARSPLARFAYRELARRIARAEAKGTPDLNLLFLRGMPFRAIAKMTNGAMSMDMAEGLLTIVNGHFFRGAGALVAGFFRNRRSTRRMRAELAR
ncbi:glycoside hydrolase family 3 C-terminal domain-containing protein [Oerskovia rustica]|uniref:Glycoside hydrolase family 3 C-terminal domain-containing protein n=1 Tax=Oerskovia rustica TaxID=2762237 RepID=A0ABR8RS11_9CELL|nr:glycoside hydrolase family 3 C-terminal domain-containing protein [Oerskovia rustica]MBD7950580.1 glycoside hydrolase family 3 C-terminal domain-containing protein [Oerskovia rustica]